jgi:hypothetical protein
LHYWSSLANRASAGRASAWSTRSLRRSRTTRKS